MGVNRINSCFNISDPLGMRCNTEVVDADVVKTDDVIIELSRKNCSDIRRPITRRRRRGCDVIPGKLRTWRSRCVEISNKGNRPSVEIRLSITIADKEYSLLISCIKTLRRLTAVSPPP